ncbi:MAG: hypothetical protein ACFFBZ_11420, partial [Promethearchaeota archaeon]
MKLDNIDKQIINILFNNGRENLINIGEKVTKTDQSIMSHTGVKKRIKKLSNSKILKIQGNININELDYKACLILLEMKNYDEVKKIL